MCVCVCKHVRARTGICVSSLRVSGAGGGSGEEADAFTQQLWCLGGEVPEEVALPAQVPGPVPHAALGCTEGLGREGPGPLGLIAREGPAAYGEAGPYEGC